MGARSAAPDKEKNMTRKALPEMHCYVLNAADFSTVDDLVTYYVLGCPRVVSGLSALPQIRIRSGCGKHVGDHVRNDDYYASAPYRRVEQEILVRSPTTVVDTVQGESGTPWTRTHPAGSMGPRRREEVGLSLSISNKGPALGSCTQVPGLALAIRL